MNEEQNLKERKGLKPRKGEVAKYSLFNLKKYFFPDSHRLRPFPLVNLSDRYQTKSLPLIEEVSNIFLVGRFPGNLGG